MRAGNGPVLRRGNRRFSTGAGCQQRDCGRSSFAAHGNAVVFFVLHEAPDDPEVRENGGNPFHNFARGTVNGDELTVAGSRENTSIRQYKLVLKRLMEK